MELESLTRWGEVPPPGDDALAEALLDDTAAVPFPVNEELNFKLALWQGDLTKLKVDAIVNCSNEDLNERSGVSGQLFAAAGPQLEEACSKLGGCAPGDVKATRGFKLPAKHVLHAVPPRWRDGGGAGGARRLLRAVLRDGAEAAVRHRGVRVPQEQGRAARGGARHAARAAHAARGRRREGCSSPSSRCGRRTCTTR